MEVSITALEKNAAFTIYQPGYKASKDADGILEIKGATLKGAGEGGDATVWKGDLPRGEKPGAQARVVKELKAGQPVKIEREMITSPGEEGPRGGPALYDQVELIPSGEKGYISRAGDDFSPFM